MIPTVLQDCEHSVCNFDDSWIAWSMAEKYYQYPDAVPTKKLLLMITIAVIVILKGNVQYESQGVANKLIPSIFVSPAKYICHIDFWL